ncbi:MAG: YbaB/EbfC family nucleoid-associated protein [Clostridia bacterium]
MGKGGGFPGMMGGQGNLQQLARQAQKLQQNMEKLQAELDERAFEATSGGGMVTVKVSGKKELLSLSIKPEAVDPEDVEMLEDMVMAAVNEALKTAADTVEREMSKMTGGMNMPGLF